MLILTRKFGQSVTGTRDNHNVKLGYFAPKSVVINQHEIIEKIHETPSKQTDYQFYLRYSL